MRYIHCSKYNLFSELRKEILNQTIHLVEETQSLTQQVVL